MGDAAFVDRFEDAGRLGTYLRVVSPGALSAGDRIVVESRPGHGMTVAFVARARRTGAIDDLERLVETPELGQSWRAWADRELARRGPR